MTPLYKIAATTAVVLGLAATTAAQTPAQQPPLASPPPAGPTPTLAAGTTSPRFDVSLGYQLLHIPDETFPAGINLDGAANFGPWSIVAEAGWVHDADSDDLLGVDITSNVFNFGAGPRWTSRRAARAWPFAQILAGGVYNRSTIEIAGSDSTASATKFMLQPGVGVVVLAGDGWGIVGQADYRRVFLDEDEDGESGQNQFRLFIGLRVVLD